MSEQENRKAAQKSATGTPALDDELASGEAAGLEQTRDIGKGNEFDADEAELALIGTTFADQYEIQQILGRGGMSVVYKARDQYLKQDIAIKTLHRNLTYDKGSLQRFQQEAATALSLDHQNIVRVRNFGISQGLPYMAMDVLKGVAFSDLIKKHDVLSVRNILHIFSQACAGLAHAHGKGVVHRDIKPSNIMLTDYDGDPFFVKILDFGIAKVLSQEGEVVHRLTQTGEIFGSPLYMCPEQWSGKAVDSRSDVYSLGCVLYEAIQGKPPFFDNNVFETMHKHLEELPPPLEVPHIDRALSDRLETIISRALEKQPDNRYQSMADFKKDLDAVASTLASTGKVTRTISGDLARTVRNVKRVAVKRKVLLISLAPVLGVLVLLGFTGWYLDVGWFFKSAPAVSAELGWKMPPDVEKLKDELAHPKVKLTSAQRVQLRKNVDDIKLLMELLQMHQGRDTKEFRDRVVAAENYVRKRGVTSEVLELRSALVSINSSLEGDSPPLAAAKIAYVEALMAEGSEHNLLRAADDMATLVAYAQVCTYFDPRYSSMLRGDAVYTIAANRERSILAAYLKSIETGSPIDQTTIKQINEQHKFARAAAAAYTDVEVGALAGEREFVRELQPLNKVLFGIDPIPRTDSQVERVHGAAIMDGKSTEVPCAAGYLYAKLGDLYRWELQNRKIGQLLLKEKVTDEATLKILAERSTQCYLKALDLLKKGDRAEDAAKVSYYLGYLAEQRGAMKEASAYFAGAVDLLEDKLAADDRNRVLSEYARALWGSFDLNRAVEIRREAVIVNK